MDQADSPDQNKPPHPPSPAREVPRAVPPCQLPAALATVIGVVVLLVLAGLIVAIAAGVFWD